MRITMKTLGKIFTIVKNRKNLRNNYEKDKEICLQKPRRLRSKVLKNWTQINRMEIEEKGKIELRKMGTTNLINNLNLMLQDDG